MDSVTHCRSGLFGRLLTVATAAILLGGCATTPPPLAATRNQIIISVRDQKLTVVKEDHTRISFPISTSKFGLGDRRGTYETPTGELAVAAKIGGGAKPGTVFHGRVSTGEIVKVDAPGRDAIVTRILALKGLEASNSHASDRGIYIHGTPEERNIGRPTSYGCIRMRSQDVIALYDMVKVGARVQIIDTTQNNAIAANIIQPTPGVQAAVPGVTMATNVTTSKLPGAAPDAPAKAAEPPISVASNVTVVKTPTPAAKLVAQGSASVPADKKLAIVKTTTIVTPGTQVPPSAAKPSATAGKKEWAGAPSKLLDKAAAADAKAKNAKPPVGAPSNARPVSNTSSDNGSNTLNHSAMDSL